MNLEIAREILTAHAKSRKNGIFPSGADQIAKLTNPICGDHVEIRFRIEEGLVKEAGHIAKACAICCASASLLCEWLRDRSFAQIISCSEDFERTLGESEPWPGNLEDFSCFVHLRTNPARRACALLPWIAMRSALVRPMPT